MNVLIAGQKGGTGKTTTAVNLATMRVLDQRDVHLYDIDPQRTATLWASLRDQNNITPRVASSQKVLDQGILNPGVVIRNEIKSLTPKYQDIIIDAGGADNEVLRAAMTLADIIIFPLNPSAFDMWTVRNLSNMVEKAQNTEGNLRGYILLNQVSTKPNEAKNDIAEVDEFLEDFDNLSRFENMLYQRKPIRKANGEGMAIVEYKPADAKAVEEIHAIFEEVFNGR